MKFTKAFLQGLSEYDECVISTEMTDSSRWSIHYRRVFTHKGRFFETYYSRGATEYQDEGPYEYDDAEIECDEVFPVEKMVTVYETR